MNHYPSTPLQEQKHRLRMAMREKRHASANDLAGTFNKLAENFLHNIVLKEGTVVASYCAIHQEIDPAPLINGLRTQGHPIALPVITGKREPLLFRLYEQGDRLLANPMSILEPASTSPEVEPDVLLIPLLAFDRQRNRLGYGGGYYDRTIAHLLTRKLVRTFGLAYAYQEIAEIPTGPNDVRLDSIVTEIAIF